MTVASRDEADTSELAAIRAQLAALTAALEAMAERRGPRRVDSTVQEIAVEYAKTLTKHYAYALKPIVEEFGPRRPSDLRRSDWLRFRQKRGLGPGASNQELTVVNGLLRWGVANELCAANPFEGVERVKGQRTRETEIAAEAHEAALADAPLLVRVFQAACMETGARNGCEVRRMERAHVDRTRGMIVFPRRNTKGQQATREVPMSDYLRGLLDDLPAVAGSPYVFANPKTGEPYSAAYLGRLSRPYLDRLKAAPGDGRVVTHDTRHSLVSRLARGGMNPMTSMKLVGHKTPAMHWRYLHVSEADREKMRALLDAQRKR